MEINAEMVLISSNQLVIHQLSILINWLMMLNQSIIIENPTQKNSYVWQREQETQGVYELHIWSNRTFNVRGHNGATGAL